MAKQKTKRPDGSKPSYKDLEASFLKVYQALEIANSEVKRLNQECASLRYDIDQLKKGGKNGVQHSI